MKTLMVNHYVEKKIQTSLVECETLKMEIRSKMIVLSDKDNVVFACKCSDFISLQF